MTGPELRALLQERNLTRRELAQRIGYSTASVVNWLRPEDDPHYRPILPRAQMLIRRAMEER